MRIRWLEVLVLAALGFAAATAEPRVGRADEVAAEAESEVAVPAAEGPSAAPTDASRGATPEPWWRPTTRAVYKVVPKP